MSRPLEIKYGGATLELRKSKQFVALRSGEQSPATTEPGLRRTPVGERGRAGGYVVLEIEAANELTARDSSGSEAPTPNAAFANVYHSSDDGVPFVPTGTIYLEFKRDVPDNQRKEFVARHGLTVVETGHDGALTLRVADGSGDAVETSAALQQDPIVEVAEPDLASEGEVKHFAMPDDAFFGRQWHLENSGQIEGASDSLKPGADARVVAAWRRMQSFGSPEVVIGIIDDGFDLSHPDLATRIVHPWDFTRGTSDVAPEPNLTSPTTGNWHGTACAGVAIGALHAGKIVGAAPGCSWMPVRWSALDPIEVVKWFDHMRENGAWIVSCSWGARAKFYPLPTRISKSIARYAEEGRNGRGGVIIFAAGNEGRDVNDPRNQSVNGWAIHPGVIAVAASTSMDERAPYSNFGNEICVCAPSSSPEGRDITTADVTGEFVDAIGSTRPKGYVPGEYNEHFGKTSSACPLVAGICGLMLSVNPELTAIQVRQILQSTARRVADPALYDANGHSKYFGYGCVNAEAAVLEARALVPSA